MRESHALRVSAWAPGLDGIHAWKDWAEGKREIAESGESPSMNFAEFQRHGIDPGEFKLFTRRLSQLSKMTIRVICEVLPLGEDTRIVFLSFRGEISRQFKINQMVIEEQSIMPAAFSMAVFNTPPAAASIALKLRAGYIALYPGNGRFGQGLLAAAAPVLSGMAEDVLLVCADELAPPEYGGLRPQARPMAFAVVLSRRNDSASQPLNMGGSPAGSPEDFLRFLIQSGAPWSGSHDRP
jgi:hypothetical protein